MGYTQKYGSVARMNSKKAGLGHSDSVALQTDPPGDKKKDKLPSYETTTYNASASGSGGGSSSTKSTSNEADYKATLVDKGPDFKPTQAQRDKANAKVAKLKALDKANAAANVASSQSTSESISTKRTTIGTQTMGQVEKKGSYLAKNRASKMAAKKEGALIKAKKDSISAANKKMASFPTDVARASEQGRRIATAAGERAGYLSLRKSGSYDAGQAREQFNPRFGRQKYETKVIQEKGLFKKEKTKKVPTSRDLKVGASGGYAK